MRAYERLMRYAVYPTASDEASDTCPTTPSQMEFAKVLADEMREMGLSEVTLDENGYLFATIPATPGCENAPVIGFIAHMDVVDCVPFENVRPRLVKYEGGDVTLSDGIVMRLAEYPALSRYAGCSLVVTDGTTLLGADDKAGIADILTAAELMLADPTIRHGKIRIGFTPDEEIGRGADRFDVAAFGAAFAYTLDGGAFGELEYENFNAASLTVTVTGVSTHPGSAKNTMRNASVIAQEYFAMLPALERPEHTTGYQGFYHLTSMSGTVESAELHFIVRDHDAAKLDGRLDYAVRAAEELDRRYGEGTVKTEIRYSYRNMREMVEPVRHIIDNAGKAIRTLGGEPIIHPIRGGTDGSRLSYMGLPCPNLGTGAHNCHGRFEYAVAEEMDKGALQIVEIAKLYADC
ncbi:MAG: peptidase T [Ruminococcaceae bacterium]|nr:peptidase T [Oscillospiraceae bacterium]